MCPSVSPGPYPSRSPPSSFEGTKVNLIDTPGYADFVGEVRAGLRAADCALFVIAANEGVDDGTRELWRECAAVGMPRAVVVTKLDHPRADHDGVVRAAQAAFGDKVLPVYVLRDGQVVESLIGTEHRRPAPRRADRGDHRGVRGRDADGPLPRWRADRREAAGRGPRDGDRPRWVLPRACRSAPQTGTRPAASCSTSASARSRSPPEHVPPDVFTPEGKTADAGHLRPGRAAGGRGREDDQRPLPRAGQPGPGLLRHPRPATPRSTCPGTSAASAPRATRTTTRTSGSAPSPSRPATSRSSLRACSRGDVAIVGRLSRAETGDTLSSPDLPRVLRPWSLPDPLLPIAIEAATRSDEDKLSAALSRLAAEDPSLRVHNNAETGQLVIWVMGEAHAEVALERLRGALRRHGRAARAGDPAPRVLRRPAKGHGRHVKQSGGHGQYAVCDIEVEPLPEGSGFEFVDKVVGGSVPRQLHPLGREGRTRADAARRAARLSRRRHPGHPDRRQGPQRRLVRHGVPDGRRLAPARGGRPGRHLACSSRTTRFRVWSPTTWSAG